MLVLMAMEKVIEYRTLRASETIGLDVLVNEAVHEGFQPFGTPYTMGGFIFQALVKTNEAARYLHPTTAPKMALR